MPPRIKIRNLWNMFVQLLTFLDAVVLAALMLMFIFAALLGVMERQP
ncbi:MAG TPA: hypothetical protein VGB92_02360 [Longimicrobium sp.]|jgi:hypothetical protein